RLSPSVGVVPLGTVRVSREFRVAVTSEKKGAASAAVRLEVPGGWSVEPAEAPLSFRYEGEETAVRFSVLAPAGLAPGVYPIRAVARQDGVEFREGYQAIAYEHVQTRHLYRASEANLTALDVKA